jgi:hypothetical protein
MSVVTRPPELWTSWDVGMWLDKSARQVEKMARQGQLPYLELPGGELRFDPAQLREWAAQLKRGGPTTAP